MADRQRYYPPSNDYIFKSLMIRNPEQLRRFLACVLPELEADLPTLAFENGEILALNQQGKNVRLDLKLTTARGEIINIEMQVANEPGLTNRMQLYLARNYSTQMASGSDYLKLHRAISVWICRFDFLDDAACQRNYVLYDREHDSAFPDSMKLVILDAAKYRLAQGPLREWLQFFAAKTEEDIMSLAVQSPSMEIPCEFVRRMNMTPEERAIADASEREWLDKAILRGAAFDEGMEAGKAEGIAEGENRRNQEIGRAMLLAGEPRAKILQFTRLTEQELDRLQ